MPIAPARRYVSRFPAVVIQTGSSFDAPGPKFNRPDLVLPGGENYREMLIKAPEPQGHREKLMELEAKLRRAPPDQVAHYQSLIGKYQKLASRMILADYK